MSESTSTRSPGSAVNPRNPMNLNCQTIHRAGVEDWMIIISDEPVHQPTGWDKVYIGTDSDQFWFSGHGTCGEDMTPHPPIKGSHVGIFNRNAH